MHFILELHGKDFLKFHGNDSREINGEKITHRSNKCMERIGNRKK